jgi:membrane associated rhomboid family serine protease
VTGKEGICPPFSYLLAWRVSLSEMRRAALWNLVPKRRDPVLARVSNGVRLANSREPILNVPPVVAVLLAVLVAIHAVRRLVLPYGVDLTLLWTFAFVPARYDPGALVGAILPGGRGAEVWSFVTYALLHADITHLGVNAVWLLAFGSPVARRFGSGRFLLFFAITVAAGALAHLLTHAGELAPMIGASAAISGTMGAAARFVFQPGGSLDLWHGDRSHADQIPAAPLMVALRNPRVIAFLLVWFGLNLLFGLGSAPFAGETQSVAWQAHIGGFLAGLLIFSAFDPVGRALDRGGLET